MSVCYEHKLFIQNSNFMMCVIKHIMLPDKILNHWSCPHVCIWLPDSLTILSPTHLQIAHILYKVISTMPQYNYIMCVCVCNKLLTAPVPVIIHTEYSLRTSSLGAWIKEAMLLLYYHRWFLTSLSILDNNTLAITISALLGRQIHPYRMWSIIICHTTW